MLRPARIRGSPKGRVSCRTLARGGRPDHLSSRECEAGAASPGLETACLNPALHLQRGNSFREEIERRKLAWPCSGQHGPISWADP